MDLTKTKTLPERAGVAATLKFVRVRKHDPAHPNLDGNTITLPIRKGSEFYPLQDGNQFLFRCFENPKNKGRHPYFGGTDEGSAFLTEIYPFEIFDEFLERGEDAFYEALKPPILRFWEEKLGIKARRQGDFYFLPLPTWDDLRPAFSLFFHNDLELIPVESASLAESRHKITGETTDELILFDRDRDINIVRFGRGTMYAPDHEPRQLNEVHLLIPSVLFDD